VIRRWEERSVFGKMGRRAV
jgi:hypothetical protein